MRDEDYLLNFTLVESKNQIALYKKAQQNKKRKQRNTGLSSYLDNGYWSDTESSRSTRTMDPVDFDRVAQESVDSALFMTMELSKLETNHIRAFWFDCFISQMSDYCNYLVLSVSQSWVVLERGTKT